MKIQDYGFWYFFLEGDSSIKGTWCREKDGFSHLCAYIYFNGVKIGAWNITEFWPYNHSISAAGLKPKRQGPFLYPQGYLPTEQDFEFVIKGH